MTTAATHPGTPPQSGAKRPRSTLGSRLGMWIFSLVAIVLLPLFPLFIEGVKNDWEIKTENYLLTAAVLAAGFGFSTEGNLYRAAYMFLFLLSVGYDFRPAPHDVANLPLDSGLLDSAKGWLMSHIALDALLLVVVLQTIERFTWHVVIDRLFPDWRKEPSV